jgi:hypothetical protein
VPQQIRGEREHPPGKLGRRDLPRSAARYYQQARGEGAVAAGLLLAPQGPDSLSYAFGRSTAFTVLAGVVGLCLPTRVAAAKSPS